MKKYRCNCKKEYILLGSYFASQQDVPLGLLIWSILFCKLLPTGDDVAEEINAAMGICWILYF